MAQVRLVSSGLLADANNEVSPAIVHNSCLLSGGAVFVDSSPSFWRTSMQRNANPLWLLTDPFVALLIFHLLFAPLLPDWEEDQ